MANDNKKERAMRKADQMRFNEERQEMETYSITVPLEWEDWELAGLEKQRKARNSRALKKSE